LEIFNPNNSEKISGYQRKSAANFLLLFLHDPRSSAQIRGKFLFLFISVYQCSYQCSSVVRFLVAATSRRAAVVDLLILVS
jgi:hypothetical protein